MDRVRSLVRTMEPHPDVIPLRVAGDPRSMIVPASPPDPLLRTAAPIAPFDDFYRTEYLGMVRVAFLVIGSREVAEELVQDAFVHVHQRWDRLDQPGGYLRTCVVNGCRDRLRRRARLGQRLPLLLTEHLSMTAANPQPGGQAVERTDLVDALATLPVRHRTALVLRFYGGFTEAEIAESLGVRPGTVKSLIHRGLERLRQELQP